jgi:DNA-binding NarL/FixJ family response regulator
MATADQLRIDTGAGANGGSAGSDVSAPWAEGIRTVAAALREIADPLRHDQPLAHRRLLGLADRLLEVNQLSDTKIRQEAERRINSFRGVQRALSALRSARTMSQLMDRASVELCNSCGFDGTFVVSLRGGMLRAEAGHATFDPDRWSQIVNGWRAEPLRLDRHVIECEMLRRRQPMAVLDAQTNPRTYKPVMQAIRTGSYVAAPVISAERVIGFVHAGHRERDVDALDLEVLQAFAQGFGYEAERMIFVDRLRSQRAQARSMAQSAERLLTEFIDTGVELIPAEEQATGGSDGFGRSMAVDPAVMSYGPLTRREYEVVALMAQGTTNQEIASRLTVSESTVKSHVQNVLRKLGAVNRAEAASNYVRMIQAPPF